MLKLLVIFVLQIQGDAVGYYRLLFRLVAQRPLKFFQEHVEWIKNPNETLAPQNGKKGKRDTKFFSTIKQEYKGTQQISVYFNEYYNFVF